MKPIVVPTDGVHDWRKRLADPVKHWKPDHSAWALAHSWEAAGGLPPEVANFLDTDVTGRLRGLKLLVAIPEYEVPLEGGSTPSQSDLLCLGASPETLAVITVEGKVDEPFDVTLAEWLADPLRGKRKRLDQLCRVLGFAGDPPGGIRYQLLHRTAAAVIEARRFHARDAVMVVHHFGATPRARDSYQDYASFVQLFGVTACLECVTVLRELEGVRLSTGWVTGDPRFLT